MRVVVVVVTFNGLKWYDQCFGSLKNSSIPLDVVIIDNASTDGTVEFIKTNYPNMYLIESNINLGFGKANNLGFNYAIEQKADYVFLLNQDAWVFENKIELLVNALVTEPRFGIVSPMHLAGKETSLDRNFSSYIARSLEYISDASLNLVQNKIYETNFINAALWLIPSSVLLKVGGFDPLFSHYGEDDNLVNRLVFHGLKIGFVPNVFGVHDRLQIGTLQLSPQRNNIYRLILATNINQSYLRCICSIFTADFRRTISNLKKFRFAIILNDFLYFVRFLFMQPNILISRRLYRN